MAKNRMVSTSFWNDNYSANLDPIEKLLFLYLITNERSTLAGIYELPIKFMAVETGIEGDMVRKILSRFEEDGKIKYLEGWVAIRNFSKHHESGSPTVKKGIEDALKKAPDWSKEFIGYAYPIDTLTPSASASASISVATAPPIEEVPEEQPERPSTAKYPHSKEVFSWFPSPEPSWKVNTTELTHSELLFVRGEKKVKSAVAFCRKNVDDPYLPGWESPTQLERNWNKIIKFADRQDV